MTPPVDTRELALHGDRIVRVRPLRATDRAIYERAVMNLSPRSRYLRFFAPIPRLGERLLDQMTQTDGHRHVAHLALTLDESSACSAGGAGVADRNHATRKRGSSRGSCTRPGSRR